MMDFRPSVFCAMASLLAMSPYSNVFAHTQKGSLAAKRGSTDIYTVVCSDGPAGPTDHLGSQIRSIPAGVVPFVSVQTIKDGKATNSADIRKNGTNFSQEVKNIGGNGSYLVIVDKVGLGKVRYELEFHCEAADGTEGEPDISIGQNQ